MLSLFGLLGATYAVYTALFELSGLVEATGAVCLPFLHSEPHTIFNVSPIWTLGHHLVFIHNRNALESCNR